MRVLVSAASKHGATTEIAAAIGTSLEAHGHAVSISDPDDVMSVGDYDALVLGSAVYAGHWQRPARELIDRISSDLAGRPVWLFSSGPIGDPPQPTADPVDVEDVVRATAARGHRIFSGRLAQSSLSFGERAIVAALRAPYGDYRNWDDIESWASDIASELDGAAR